MQLFAACSQQHFGFLMPAVRCMVNICKLKPSFFVGGDIFCG